MGSFKTRAAVPLVAAGLLLLAGCSRGPKRDEDFTPPSDKAKQASNRAQPLAERPAAGHDFR